MAVVTFTQNLRRHLEAPPAEVAARTVREALDRVFETNPRLRGYVLDDQGRLRKHVVVFVDGEMIADRAGMGDAIGGGAEIFVMQALSGG